MCNFLNTLQHRFFAHALATSQACLLLWALVANPAHAEQSINVSVLYPDTSVTHSRLYQTIIDGMVTDSNINIMRKGFGKNTPVNDIHKLITDNNSHAAIILGKQGRELSQKLNIDIPVITGGHILADKDRASVSLAADPARLFQMLKQLQPDTQRVIVIHSAINTGWMIKQAEVAAKEMGLQLLKHNLEHREDISVLFKSILNEARSGRDAIWLPLDPAIPTREILPHLLKMAWEKNLTVFSNNPVDVKKGILFAMYPDYSNMGKQLLELVRTRLQNRDNASPEASRYLNAALNTRTASHLGISVDKQLQSNIKLIFPRRQ